MGRNTSVTVSGNGNNISTDSSANTVTINGRTYDLPETGSITVDGNTVSVTAPRR